MGNNKAVFSKIAMALPLLFLLIAIYTSVQLIHTGKEAKALKSDYAQLHSVEYGLFNSSIWSDKMAHIVDMKIDEFQFTSTPRQKVLYLSLCKRE